MADITMKELLEAGAHFGHQTTRWNPKMRPFIFTERGGVHIFDLEITQTKLKEALDYIKGVAESGRTVLFVATKKQARTAVKEEAQRSGSPFVVDRWMGGTLTNFKTFYDRIKKLKQMEEKNERGDYKELTKKERLQLGEQIEELNRTFEGIKELEGVPGAMFIIDVVKDKLAVKEAHMVGVPTVGVCDTNADPGSVEYAIPANDDALRSIALLARAAADAVLEGKDLAQKKATKLVSEEPPQTEKAEVAPPAEPKPKKKAATKKKTATKKKPAKKKEPKDES